MSKVEQAPQSTEALAIKAMDTRVDMDAFMGPVSYTIKSSDIDSSPISGSEPTIRSGNRRKGLGPVRSAIAGGTLAVTLTAFGGGVALGQEQNQDESPTPDSPTLVEPSPIPSMTPESSLSPDAETESISRFERVLELPTQEDLPSGEFGDLAIDVNDFFSLEKNAELHGVIVGQFEEQFGTPESIFSKAEKQMKKNKKNKRDINTVATSLAVLVSAYAESNNEQSEEVFDLIKRHLGTSLPNLNDPYSNIVGLVIDGYEEALNKAQDTPSAGNEDVDTGDIPEATVPPTPKPEATASPTETPKSNLKTAKDLIKGKHPRTTLDKLAPQFTNYFSSNQEAKKALKDASGMSPQQILSNCKSNINESRGGTNYAICRGMFYSSLEAYNNFPSPESWKLVRSAYNFVVTQFPKNKNGFNEDVRNSL